MIKRRSGRIINIASTGGLAALIDQVHYVAAKHGVVGITRALAIEWGRYGITVNCICPGLTETPTSRSFIQNNPEYISQRLTKIPLGRLGKTSDQAKVALFLASSDADYVTGQAIVVDGGTFPLYAGYSPPPRVEKK
jgi:NAD(P)-dependent dehydrogenase (short-subunit alcohol dehydrogenase family)